MQYRAGLLGAIPVTPTAEIVIRRRPIAAADLKRLVEAVFKDMDAALRERVRQCTHALIGRGEAPS